MRWPAAAAAAPWRAVPRTPLWSEAGHCRRRWPLSPLRRSPTRWFRRERCSGTRTSPCPRWPATGAPARRAPQALWPHQPPGTELPARSWSGAGWGRPGGWQRNPFWCWQLPDPEPGVQRWLRFSALGWKKKREKKKKKGRGGKKRSWCETGEMAEACQMERWNSLTLSPCPPPPAASLHTGCRLRGSTLHTPLTVAVGDLWGRLARGGAGNKNRHGRALSLVCERDIKRGSQDKMVWRNPGEGRGDVGPLSSPLAHICSKLCGLQFISAKHTRGQRIVDSGNEGESLSRMERWFILIFYKDKRNHFCSSSMQRAHKRAHEQILPPPTLSCVTLAPYDTDV